MKSRLKHVFTIAAMTILYPLSTQAYDGITFTEGTNSPDTLLIFDTTSDTAPKFQPQLWMSTNEDTYGLNDLIQKHTLVFVDFVNKFTNEFSIHSIAYKLNNTSTEEIAHDLKHSTEDVERFIKDFQLLYDKRQYKNNCYSYAVNDIYGEDHYAGGKPFPGENTLYKSSANFRQTPRKLKHVVTEGAKADGLLPAGKTLPKIKEGYYRVALMINGEKDFHWIREDQSGLWSGKWGHTGLHTTDNNNKPITNPDRANFGDYKVTKYFYVPEGGINLQKNINPPYNNNSPSRIKH